MAEGEDPFAYKDPVLDDDLDNDGDLYAHDFPIPDDDDDDEQEVDTTRPFYLGASSTPYNRGEQYEMQTMMHEQSGLPDVSYEETPLLGTQAEIQSSWDALTRLFPRASATDLETSYSKSGRLQVKRSGIGKKSYPLFTKDKQTGQDQIGRASCRERV